MSPVDLIQNVIDYVLHLDRHVAELVENYGGWALLILFLIIFCETGLVVTPFLPGDSLLFAAGAIAATGALNVGTLIVLLIVAAILGDSTNYWIGSRVGTRPFTENARVLKTEYLRRAQDFFARYGGKTIVIARFVPIVRTYVPFVAGVGAMPYGRYLAFCVAGAVIWVGSLCTAGYFFGNLPIIRNNLTVVIMAIVLLSISPGLVAWARTRSVQRQG